MTNKNSNSLIQKFRRSFFCVFTVTNGRLKKMNKKYGLNDYCYKWNKMSNKNDKVIKDYYLCFMCHKCATKRN